MQEDHGQGLEDVLTKMDLWGQLDEKHEGGRAEYGIVADIGQEETIQIEIFPSIGTSQGMGE